ncbi:MAG: recombinase zinc beta ribbon domain-containing protein [Planctomycetota bacterium]|nr:recombinase zinc beta ribbon domain-containing protein [Planctomycetota bacterium]
MDRRNSPAGEGPALLQGLVLCGICGRRMTVKCHTRAVGQMVDYNCQYTRCHHSQAGDQDRKHIVRLLIEDVTLIKAGEITVNIRFKGGTTQTLTLPIPLSAWEERTIPSQVIHQIDRLLDIYADAGVAAELNRRGCCSGMKLEFTPTIVARLCRHYGLRCRYDHLREKGVYTACEMAAELGVSRTTTRIWDFCKATRCSGPPGTLNPRQAKTGNRVRLDLT